MVASIPVTAITPYGRQIDDAPQPIVKRLDPSGVRKVSQMRQNPP